MAMSAMSSATSTIGSLLTDEAKYLWGVKGGVERLQSELRWMKSFLSSKGADVQEGDDQRIQEWVAEIRELAYDAEDVVESFALKIKPKRKEGFLNTVKRSACILNELCLLHKTRSNIEKILTRIADLTRRLQTYGIRELTDMQRSSASNIRRELRQSYPYVDENNIVGLMNDIKEVVMLLTKDCRCRVVSVCGMGGLGKTTLAKKVFNHKDVRKEFVHFAWIYVSQQFQRRKVWEQVLSSFNKMDEGLRMKGDEDVAKELSNFLEGKKCLVILDDVWNTQDWSLLSPAFLLKETRSKILLTSRNKEVTKAANEERSCIYELKALNKDNSWELFQNVVFQNIARDYTDYSRLKELGEGMVNQCAGLPLAIIVLGGLLKKYSSQEWQKVSQHVETYLKRDKDRRIEDVLALSYEELPSYLRPCFLYLSHFPENYEIPAYRLIQFWVAEGFVSSVLDQEEIVEDVAERYLVELVERFMIQVGERDVATLKIKTCRMHDLMRDLCLSKAKQENFLHIIDHSSHNKLSSHTIRRIVANGCSQVSIKGCNNVRSILFFDDLFQEDSRDESSIGFKTKRVLKFQGSSSWKYIFNNFKFIRVLDFEGRRRLVECKLLNDIGNLIHLRFLSFRHMSFNGNLPLPSSLGNLTCLQTLDLRFDGWTYVPNVFWRLEQLKHLYLPRLIRLEQLKHLNLPSWMQKEYPICKQQKLALHTLTKLQTLVNFNKELCFAKDLSRLISLRKLKMIRSFTIENDFDKDLGGNPIIIESKHFRSLSISLDDDIKIHPIDLAIFLSSSSNLFKLSLNGGKIAKLPAYCHFSSDIAEIILEECKLEEDPMPTLEKLPNLRILKMKDAFIGKEMVCSSRSFPKLHSLTLDWLNLEEWKVDDGAMPALCHLSIYNCPYLKKLPNGLRFIKALQELKFTEMPKEFIDKVKEAGFQHVPSIIFQRIYYHEYEDRLVGG